MSAKRKSKRYSGEKAEPRGAEANRDTIKRKNPGDNTEDDEQRPSALCKREDGSAKTESTCQPRSHDRTSKSESKPDFRGM